jgi:hypothetical protein
MKNKTGRRDERAYFDAPSLTFGQANILRGLAAGHTVRFDDGEFADASFAAMHASGLVLRDISGRLAISDLGRVALGEHARENLDAARRWLEARTGSADGS